MIKKIKKINSTIGLHVLYIKKRMYILPKFYGINQIIKKSFSSNESKRRRMRLSCGKKNYQHYQDE